MEVRTEFTVSLVDLAKTQQFQTQANRWVRSRRPQGIYVVENQRPASQTVAKEKTFVWPPK